MVTTTNSYTSSRYRTPVGDGYDGVVRIAVGSAYGTGTLLYDGRAILTAAHLMSGVNPGQVSIAFETTAGTTSLTAGSIEIHAEYDAANANHDLALVWLSGTAPVSADRYGIYRDGDEIGQTFELVGYGKPGTGSAGTDNSYSGQLRLKAQNQFDADGGMLKDALGSAIGWTPTAEAILMADFDNGESARDALGSLVGVADLGLGADEGLNAPGDSGGPAFIAGLLAGVTSYTAALYQDAIQPDIDSKDNSSFGEIGFWQRVGAQQQWIDQSLRAAYPDAPTSTAAVKTTIVESDSGTSLAYFLVEFLGTRSAPDVWLSVDYATRDGSALAGSDYLETQGTLILYPGESQAVVAVEIVGDYAQEIDETFYLDVFNPVGGGFGEGILELTAMRTIQNDD